LSHLNRDSFTVTLRRLEMAIQEDHDLSRAETVLRNLENLWSEVRADLSLLEKERDALRMVLNSYGLTENLTPVTHGGSRQCDETSDIFQDIINCLFTCIHVKEHGSTVGSEEFSYTYGHCDRVAAYSTIIARNLGLEERDLARVQGAARIHDIGRLGVPGEILSKKGNLRIDEWEAIKKHPELGANIVLGRTHTDGLTLATKLTAGLSSGILCHHIWFDGRPWAFDRHSGRGAGSYPELNLHVSGTSIPLDARIIAVADVFDALTQNRPFRDAIEKKEAVQPLIEGKGTQFDPEIVEAFINSEEFSGF
jgi:HD-GYP domain-containing protein (c-di-GMP phosphodiesterase class II)